ncbi:MAG: thioredoxin domain-containing protein [Chrysiogenetes bacterium]|nr:thioredoxin domain-containing protein [Chrysiogenetes bacterium]
MKYWLCAALIVLSVQACEPGSAEKAPAKGGAAAEAAAPKAVKVEASKDGPGIWGHLGIAPAHAEDAAEPAPLDLSKIDTTKMIRTIRAELDVPEGVDVRIDDIRPSLLPGLAQARMILSKGNMSEDQMIFFSNDGRYVSAYSMYEFDEVVTSPVAGFYTLKLKAIGGQDEGESKEFQVSEDGKLLTMGDFWDTSIDPNAARMAKISLDKTASRGKQGSKVVLVEFSDFQCPYCSRAATTIAERIYPEYKDRVEFHFKHLPLSFHDWAKPAANAALCVKEQGEDKFWKAYSYLFENQRSISRANIDQKVRDMAQVAGANAKEFAMCYQENRHAAEIERDMAEANSLGITGTPAFVINGRKLSGAQPYSAFKQILDEELANNQ